MDPITAIVGGAIVVGVAGAIAGALKGDQKKTKTSCAPSTQPPRAYQPPPDKPAPKALHNPMPISPSKPTSEETTKCRWCGGEIGQFGWNGACYDCNASD